MRLIVVAFCDFVQQQLAGNCRPAVRYPWCAVSLKWWEMLFFCGSLCCPGYMGFFCSSAGLSSDGGALVDSGSSYRPISCPPGEINITDIALGTSSIHSLYTAAGNTVRTWDLRMWVSLLRLLLLQSFADSNISRDVPDIRFRLAGYPAIFLIRFWLQFRPKWYQVPDISAG